MSPGHQPPLSRGKSSTSLKEDSKKKAVKKFTAGKLTSHSRNSSYGKNLSKLTRIKSHESSVPDHLSDERPNFMRSKSSCEVLTKGNKSKSSTKLNTMVLRNKSLTNLQRIRSRTSIVMDLNQDTEGDSSRSIDDDDEEEEVDSFDDDERVIEMHDPPYLPSPLSVPAVVPEEPIEEYQSSQVDLQNTASHEEGGKGVETLSSKLHEHQDTHEIDEEQPAEEREQEQTTGQQENQSRDSIQKGNDSQQEQEKQEQENFQQEQKSESPELPQQPLDVPQDGEETQTGGPNQTQDTTYAENQVNYQGNNVQQPIIENEPSAVLHPDTDTTNRNQDLYQNVKPDSLHKLYGANLLLSQSTGVERSINGNPGLPSGVVDHSVKKPYENSSFDFYGKLRHEIQQNEEEQANMDKLNRNLRNPLVSDFSNVSSTQLQQHRQQQQHPLQQHNQDTRSSNQNSNEELHTASSTSSLIFQPSTANLSKIMYKQTPRPALPQTQQLTLTRNQPSFQLGSQANLSNLNAPSGPSSYTNSNDTNLPTDFSQFLSLSGTNVETRTQQKLWLQRENSIMEGNSSKSNVNNLLMSYATNSQFRTEFEKYSREYLNIRRYTNPLVDSLERLRSDDDNAKLKSRKIRGANSDEVKLFTLSGSLETQDLSSFDAFCSKDLKSRLDEISVSVNNLWKKSYEQYTDSQSTSPVSGSSTYSNLAKKVPVGILNNVSQGQQKALGNGSVKRTGDYFPNSHANPPNSSYVQASQPYIAPPTTRAQRQNGRTDPSTNFNVTAANNLH